MRDPLIGFRPVRLSGSFLLATICRRRRSGDDARTQRRIPRAIRRRARNMHGMPAPSVRTTLQKLDTAATGAAASRLPLYLRDSFFRNGIRFFTNAFLGLAEFGSLCE
jgi:hypothetical protein